MTWVKILRFTAMIVVGAIVPSALLGGTSPTGCTWSEGFVRAQIFFVGWGSLPCRTRTPTVVIKASSGQDLADSLCQFLLLQHADAMSEHIADSSNHARVSCISQTDTSSGDSVVIIRLGYSDDLRFSVAHIFEFPISQQVLYHYDPIEDRRVVYALWLRDSLR